MKRLIVPFGFVLLFTAIVFARWSQTTGKCPECGRTTIFNPGNARQAWCESCQKGFPIVNGVVVEHVEPKK